MDRQLFIGALLLLLSAGAYPSQTVYLSPTGCDSGKGTADSPYYTLNKAAEAAFGNDSSTDTLFIHVASGDYYMDRPFTIDRPSSRPIVIQGDNSGDRPRFLGAVRINGWERCDNGLYRAFVPEVTHYGFEFEQLFVNGKRATLARTPNDNWFFVENSSETPHIQGIRAADYATQKICFNPKDWQGMKDIRPVELDNLKFRFFHKWDITHKPADIVQTDSAFIYIRGGGMKPWNPIRKGSRYLMYDYKAALDMPGEWYLDRKSGYVYYIPLEGENMQEVECFAPSLRQLIDFKGEPGRPVSNLTFRNLSFQYSAYQMPDKGEEPAQAASFADAAFMFEFTEKVAFIDCELQHTGAYAIWFQQECHHNRVEHCYLNDLGGGGIKIGEPYLRLNNRPFTSHQTIHNNIITHVGRELPCGVGVAIMHSSDNTVTHNEISDLYYSGVSVGWLWGYNYSDKLWTGSLNEKGEYVPLQAPVASPAVRNTIAYNHIHHIGWGELSDMGAVYTLGESEGTKVVHNVIHDVLSYDYGGWGLYTDEGSTGVEMTNNLVYRCKSGGFHQHYGKDNKIENNIFAFGHYYQAQYTRPEEHLSFSFKHNIILQENGETLNGAWEKGQLDIDSNLYWSIGEAPQFVRKYNFQEWKKQKEPHSIYADPLFKDWEKDDFTFCSHKAIRKIGFKPFDYSQAGVTGEQEWKEKAQLNPDIIQAFNKRAQERLKK